MAKRNVVVAHSRGKYTVYIENGTKVEGIIYEGKCVPAEAKAAEVAQEQDLHIKHMNYPIVGKRRTSEDATKDFNKYKAMKIRKDLLTKALETLGLTTDTVVIFNHGPFSYVRKPMMRV